MLKESKIALLAALMVLLAVFACLLWIEFQPAEVPFYLEVQGENGTEQYACWRGEDQQCYVFLPGYTDFARSRIVLNTGDALYLDGERLNEETDCSIFQENHAYGMTYDGLFQQQLSLTFIKSGQIPVVHIDTESGSVEYIHGKKGNEEKADIRIYTADGALVCNDTLKSIACRGNSTFDEAKKPYTVKFTEPRNVLGMGSAKKWTLLANALDPTNLRNYLAMEVAKQMGVAYTPDMQWVELYLNQEYAGLYLLSEKVEVNENRVEIPQEGSYLFSLEDRGRIITQNLPHYDTAAGQTVRIRHPEVLDKTTNETIDAIIQRAENAILSEDGKDPDSGVAWDEIIDVDSWASKYLIEEITASIDAGKWSQYFYVSGDDEKIYAGPVWDYDLSMAISWQTEMPNIWYCSRLTADGNPISPWFEALSRKPAFMQRVMDIYETEALPVMMDLIDEGIDQAVQITARSSMMNALRWNVSDVPESDVERIREYLRQRIGFLNDIWLEGTEYVAVTAYLGDADGYTNLMMPVGSFMDTLPMLQENEFHGWYWTLDGTPVEPNQIVEQGSQIYALFTKTPQQNNRMMKLAPLGVIAVIGVGLLWIEVKRRKRSR